MLEKDSRIFVAGHGGLVGSAMVRRLTGAGHIGVVTRSRAELDLLDQRAVRDFFARESIDFVFVAAARVGGIIANATQQADFLYENLVIAANVIHAAAESNVEKLLFLGSSCVYPKNAPQPMREESLLSGPLEETNEGYAIAKIAGLKLCEYYYRQYGKHFIAAMPTNLYGPGDSFHPVHSHVIPGMMRRFYEAKLTGKPEVVIWGSGLPRREFLHADDLADALYLLMQHYDDPIFINVGTGKDCTVAQLAELMCETVGYKGSIAFDATKPDGAPRKLLDVRRIGAMGWRPRISLREGLKTTFEWCLANHVFDFEPARVS
jgi:GDP-L-fucose synthase